MGTRPPEMYSTRPTPIRLQPRRPGTGILVDRHAGLPLLLETSPHSSSVWTTGYPDRQEFSGQSRCAPPPADRMHIIVIIITRRVKTQYPFRITGHTSSANRRLRMSCMQSKSNEQTRTNPPYGRQPASQRSTIHACSQATLRREIHGHNRRGVSATQEPPDGHHARDYQGSHRQSPWR